MSIKYFSTCIFWSMWAGLSANYAFGNLGIGSAIYGVCMVATYLTDAVLTAKQTVQRN